MENNKGQAIFLSVIGVATLLVAIIGATFAYFTASVSGNTEASSIVVNTATIASINFLDGDQVTMPNALPGTTVTKEFDVNLAGTDTITVPMTYNVTFQWVNGTATNQITDLYYTLTAPGNATNPVVTGGDINHSLAAQTQAATTIGSATFAKNTVAGSAAGMHRWVMTIVFPETGSNQNSQQGLAFNGKIQVEFTGGEDIIYNSANPTGSAYNAD